MSAKGEDDLMKYGDENSIMQIISDIKFTFFDLAIALLKCEPFSSKITILTMYIQEFFLGE